MTQVGFIHHDIFLQHDTGLSHPENHHRIRALYEHVKRDRQGNQLVDIEAVPCQEAMLRLIHDSAYIDYIKKTCNDHQTAILDDGDTRVCKDSFNVALYAAGAAIQAVQLVNDNSAIKRAFVAARPPGHHALKNHAMGFCLFNNIAIAARYAQSHLGFERVMIIDWDVHHGNGTQEAFYDDPSVLFCSIHEYPYFPGTGSEQEKGAGDGVHFTINIPVPPGAEMDHYRDAMKNQIIPAATAFAPELLLLSAGFDAHTSDPIANLNLRDEDYYELTRLCTSIADRFCGGKLVSILEGGHHEGALSRSVMQHLLAMTEITS